MTTFAADDVVKFADGIDKIMLWGDLVTVPHLFVDGMTADGKVRANYGPYSFTIDPETLVKIGEAWDMVYCEDVDSPNYGNEVYVWFPELNEELAEQRDSDTED